MLHDRHTAPSTLEELTDNKGGELNMVSWVWLMCETSDFVACAVLGSQFASDFAERPAVLQ